MTNIAFDFSHRATQCDSGFAIQVPTDQSQSLKTNLPHRPTNHDSQFRCTRIRRVTRYLPRQRCDCKSFQATKAPWIAFPFRDAETFGRGREAFVNHPVYCTNTLYKSAYITKCTNRRHSYGGESQRRFEWDQSKADLTTVNPAYTDTSRHTYWAFFVTHWVLGIFGHILGFFGHVLGT